MSSLSSNFQAMFCCSKMAAISLFTLFFSYAFLEFIDICMMGNYIHYFAVMRPWKHFTCFEQLVVFDSCVQGGIRGKEVSPLLGCFVIQ